MTAKKERTNTQHEIGIASTNLISVGRPRSRGGRVGKVHSHARRSVLSSAVRGPTPVEECMSILSAIISLVVGYNLVYAVY